jgi:hypothetical protein
MNAPFISTEDFIEHACRSRLSWQRAGAAWVLWCGRRRMGRVVPDSTWAGHVPLDGGLSIGRLVLDQRRHHRGHRRRFADSRAAIPIV